MEKTPACPATPSSDGVSSRRSRGHGGQLAARGEHDVEVGLLADHDRGAGVADHVRDLVDGRALVDRERRRAGVIAARSAMWNSGRLLSIRPISRPAEARAHGGRRERVDALSTSAQVSTCARPSVRMETPPASPAAVAGSLGDRGRSTTAVARSAALHLRRHSSPDFLTQPRRTAPSAPLSGRRSPRPSRPMSFDSRRRTGRRRAGSRRRWRAR